MSKLIYHKSNLYDLIIKSDRGKLFKGHSFNLTSSNNEICLVNNYFGGTVVNHYEVNGNITKNYYSISAGYIYPEWLKAIKKRLITLNLPLILEVESNGYILNYNTSSYISLTYESLNEGISFTSHRQNINKLNEMTKLYRHTRSIIKSLTDEDLMSFQVNHGRVYAGHKDSIQLPLDILHK